MRFLFQQNQWRPWLAFILIAIFLPAIGLFYAKPALFSKQALEKVAGPGEGYYWAASQYRYAVQRLYGEAYAYSLRETRAEELELAYDVLQSKYLVLTHSIATQLRQIPESAALLKHIAVFMDKITVLFSQSPRDPVVVKTIRLNIAQMLPVTSDLVMTAHAEEVRLRDLTIEHTLMLGNFTLAGLIVWMVLTVFLAREWVKIRRRSETIRLQEKALAAAKTAHEEAVHTALARTALLSTVSHEILTPLHTIQGGMELLADSIKNLQDLRTIINVQSAASYLSQLMQDLLEMNRLDAGRMILRPTLFDPKQLIANVVAEYQHIAKLKGIRLYFVSTATVSGAAYADKTRARQVVNNLLSNAVRYTDQGEIRVALDQISHPLAQLTIQVTDTGIGIRTEAQATLFEPFTQAGEASRGGVGMGLAIVWRLTKLMGGSVELVHSEIGKGSTFLAKLPLTPLMGETKHSITPSAHVSLS